ncbi:hypothetical protein GF391_04320 [Candidatus Uhrbacteria bacterium]|nr:hypothetical protein [Candidatus Uhrbacteria bacterium]
MAQAHQITAVRITIQDCHNSTAWARIAPYLYKLYDACLAHNRAREEMLQRMSPTQSAIYELHSESYKKALKSVEFLQAELRRMGVHFEYSRHPDIFCAAFTEAMIEEFGEVAMKVAVY